MADVVKAEPGTKAGTAGANAGGGKYTEIQDVDMVNRGVPSKGTIRLSKDGLAFQSKSTKKVQSISHNEMTALRWLRKARGYEVRISMKNGTFAFFGSMREKQKDAFSAFFKEKLPDIKIEEIQPSVKGANAGDAQINGSLLTFMVDDKPSFEVPLNAVSNANYTKAEAVVEFHVNESGDDVQHIESMRFMITRGPEDFEDDTQRGEAVQEFVKQVLAKADIVQITGDALATFTQMSCVTPRGKYQIELFPKFLRLHGTTYDHKFPYDRIVRLFLLPKPGQKHFYFAVNVDPPVRQGHTRYPFLIFQFGKEEEISIELNMELPNAKEAIGDIDEKLEGSTYEVISMLFKQLTGRKIAVPGRYNSYHEEKALKCTNKAQAGCLYPLERSFLFIPKPSILIRFEDISCITFSRVSQGTTSSFDLIIEMKDQTTTSKYEFSSINREEYESLAAYIESKKLRIANIQSSNVAEFDTFKDDSDGEIDPHMQRINAEVEQFNDDTSSDDESFHGSDMQSSSISEEWENDSDHGSPKTKKKKKKKEETPSDSDSGSDSDASSKPKKKKKKVEKPTKKKKKKKDPNAPKKPLTAYFIFMAQSREAIKSENPEASLGEMAKLIGAKWGKLTAEEKKPFEDQSAALKAQYLLDKAEYEKNKPPSEDDDDDDDDKGEKASKASPKKRAKRKKDPNAPKKPQSSYMLWLAANRDKIKTDNPGIKFGEIGKEAGKLWNEMKAEDKAEWDEKATAAKEAYVEAFAKYKEEHPEAFEASSPKQAKKRVKKSKDSKQQKLSFTPSSNKEFKSAEIVVDSSDED